MTSALDLLLLLSILSSSCLNSQAKITYADHCSSIVPQPSFPTLSLAKNIRFGFSNAYFTGGENIFSSLTPSSSSKTKISGKVRFYNSEIYSTQDPNIYHLSSRLSIIEKPTSHYSNWRASDPKGLRSHVSYINGNTLSAMFYLSGFWSNSTGKLCMVGTGTSWSSDGKNLKLSAMYTMIIYDHIVRGSINSVDSPESSNHFDTISVVGYHKSKDYAYTKIPAVKAMCASLKVYTKSLGFENHDMSNYITHLMTTFHLECGKDCITPFFTSSEIKFMSLNSIESSEDGKVTMLIGFSNSSYYDYDRRIVPGKSLVAEGYWDSSKKLLCVLACPLLEDLSTGECTIGLSFRFPSVFTVKDRASVLGSIWSTKGIKEPGYFSAVSLRSLGDGISGFIPGVKYEYTKSDSVEKSCVQMNHSYARLGRYPNGNSITDLNFDLTVTTKDNKTMPGYAVPFSLDDDFFGNSFLRITNDVSFLENKNYFNHSSYRVSYLVKYGLSTEEESMTDILAEGIYHSKIGKFCMVGCKSPSYNSDDDSQDCDIQIDIQLSPYDIYTNNTGIRHLVNGTIVSTRNNSDPRYFEPLTLSSYTMYESEFHSVVERMDMEIIFLMVSLTLSCIFIMMQIFHIRKHKNVIPSISIIMLVIRITGNVVLLVLNLESLFVNSSSRSVMLWSGGWIEVNGVIVRVLTLVAFLLHLRLLQVTWDNSKFREMKVLKFLLPLYFGGALISWLVQRRTFGAQHVIGYCGLIFNGFLLPQIMFNFIVDTKEKALAPVFYMGTTAVGVLPHIYNAYRARYSVPYMKFSHIYANEDGGFFSSIWDFIIPLVSVLFAILVFLQQKYGGTCLVPLRFRKNAGYERVPIISL